MDRIIEDLVAKNAAIRLCLRLLDLYDGGQTYAHSWRVGRGVAAIGALVGWSTARVEQVVTAALLHDLGKLFLPLEIVSKPSALLDEEWTLVRRHPRFGFEVVRVVDEDVAQLLVAHHECAWRSPETEGRNYPRAGQRRRRRDRRRIARVLWEDRRHTERRADDTDLRPYRLAIAVADVIDALAAERWYKAPWSDDAIRQVAHAHFPIIPDIADALLAQRAELQRPVPDLHRMILPHGKSI